MKMNTVARDDIELTSNIYAYGTWEDTRYMFDEHNSFDIYEYLGKYWKIYLDNDYKKMIHEDDEKYGVFVEYEDGSKKWMGISGVTTCQWDTEEEAQKCADILMSHKDKNHVAKAIAMILD